MTGLLAVAFAAAVGGLHVLFSGAGWFAPVLAFALLVLVLSAVVRSLSSALWLPPLVSAAAVLVACTVFFAPLSGILLLIPGPATWSEFGRLFTLAARSIEAQAVPADANQPIVFVLCLAAAGEAMVADLLAVALRSPALAGVPLLALLAAPGVIVAGISDPLPFVVVALCFLAMLRLGAPPGQRAISVAIGAVAVIGALVLPPLLPPVTTEASGDGPGVSTGINPVLSLGRDLRRSEERRVLEYGTKSGDGEYLRLTTVDDFEGEDWEPSVSRSDGRNSLDSIPEPPGLNDDVTTEKESSRIRILSLDSPWLPAPYPPTSVSGVDGGWRWSARDLSISRQSAGSAGQEYTVTSLSPDPTAEQLRSAGGSTPPQLEPFLETPGDLDPVVAETARAVVGDAGSDYAKAVALQDYFRYGDFSYSETAPVEEGYDGTGAGVIATFLEKKSGYCIHFASAMAVMARTVGIPSRIAVGFLPGTRISGDGPAEFAVSSHDLHAWPELYFDGLGWLRFEPTVSRGELPGYADPATADAPSLPGADDPAASAAPTPSAVPSAPPPAADGVDAGSGATSGARWSWIWPAALLLVVLITIGAPAILRRLQRGRRRRRLRRGLAPPTLAWRELLQSADDLGIRVPPTLTPAEVPAVLLPGGPRDSTERIAEAVERESYSREGLAADPSIVTDLDAAIVAVRESASRGARLRAALLPRSIWAALPSAQR